MTVTGYLLARDWLRARDLTAALEAAAAALGDATLDQDAAVRGRCSGPRCSGWSGARASRWPSSRG